MNKEQDIEMFPEDKRMKKQIEEQLELDFGDKPEQLEFDFDED